MKYYQIGLLLVIGFLFTACSVEAVPINYGQDACHFCKMNVVDQQHAAEIVTKKGRAYKYDAIECMVQDANQWADDEIALFLLTDYATPGKLIDATSATFLISKNLPSPMGANLTGFESKAIAEETHKQKAGSLLNWKELREKYKK